LKDKKHFQRVDW